MNGNDQLVWMEKNIEDLDAKFLGLFDLGELQEFMLKHEDVMDSLKKDNERKWNSFEGREYTNSFGE